MPIISAAIVPHPPVLIPNIGKENVNRLKATRDAYERLEHNLYSGQIDTLIIISPHGQMHLESFTMNLSPKFIINFEEFGDFSTRQTIAGDLGLAYKIREDLETKAPLQLTSQPILDHGSSIPIYLLSQHLPKIKIIPLYYCGLDLTSHYNFGRLLKRELLINQNRTAVLASGDLSHRLSKEAPAGYSPKGKKFDKKLIECLTNGEVKKIINLDQKFIAEAGECGLKSIVILLGILEGLQYQPQLFSYEAPFGVGYLVMNFKL